ncbi:hypothetical protein BBB39_12460 [Bordetella trematum]|uniref:Uncharacterized protein n=1 Tax=Bordetella trematum TaxID=123899 RepID=A0A146AG98_9BORD|nr:hypothetical protein [Bordetella trematum]AZR94495.1 hypothetical protein BBB39_12460 [Bordetella trematum]NNH19242.1 hypothetical protein [Bordetella trematum]CZZ87995.1 Uncharacterised protein [Bordetella trematum]SAI73585.1 Uncharacterised protein [Bordetella trematum]SUV97278.1 Uncharacterised protein [Bordetella trematum]
MTLIRASIHKMQTKHGDEVEYARLLYRDSAGTFIGQSLRLRRLSPELLGLARAGYGINR